MIIKKEQLESIQVYDFLWNDDWKETEEVKVTCAYCFTTLKEEDGYICKECQKSLKECYEHS